LKLSIKQWVQVILSLAFAVFIFWYLYKDISGASLWMSIQETNMGWLFGSIAVAMVGYYLRAWRWKLLLQADGNEQVTTYRVFLALMIGYLANMVIPRAGEVARCGVLAQTDQITIGKSIGTVILERTIDLLFFLGLIFLGFAAESKLFLSLLSDLVSIETLQHKVYAMLPLLLAGLAIAVLFAYIVFAKYRDKGIFKKIRHFIRDVISGLISLKKVNNQWGFWGASFLIWISYYLTMVMVAWAIPSTASLSLSSILMVMVMGSIGMIAPVQGGIGTFHALVAFILMVFGLTEEEGKIFAAIIHGSQVLTIIVVGLVSLGLYFKIISRKASKIA
jgi:glycosyltransferase 2 family protein